MHTYAIRDKNIIKKLINKELNLLLLFINHKRKKAKVYYGSDAMIDIDYNLAKEVI